MIKTPIINVNFCFAPSTSQLIPFSLETRPPPPPGFESSNETELKQSRKDSRNLELKDSYFPTNEDHDHFEDSDEEGKHRVECPDEPDCYAEFQRAADGVLLKTVVLQKRNEEPLVRAVVSVCFSRALCQN